MPTLNAQLRERGHEFSVIPPINVSLSPNVARATARAFDADHPDDRTIIVHNSHPTGALRPGRDTVWYSAAFNLRHSVWNRPHITGTPQIEFNLPMQPDSNDDDTAYNLPVATVVPGIVYTHIASDFVHDSTADEHDLTQLVDLLDTALTWAAAYPSDLQTVLGNDAAHEAIEAILTPSPVGVIDLRREIDDLEHTRTTLENRLNNTTEQLELLTPRLTSLRTSLDSAIEGITNPTDTPETIINYLDNQPLIDDWFMPDDECLRVVTTGLEMSHPDILNGEPMPLGAFAITFSRNGNLRCVNITDRRGRRDHPHIVEGDFCTGAYAQTIRSLMQEGKMIDAINLILNFLQTFAPDDDYGRNWYLWDQTRGDNSLLAPETIQPDEAHDINA